MLSQLDSWRKEVKAPVPSKRNPQYDAEAEAEAIKRIGARKPAKGQRKRKSKKKIG